MPTALLPRRTAGRLALGGTAALSLALAGCSAAAPPHPTASVTVAIAPAAQSTEYEVQLHAVHDDSGAGGYRSVHRISSGQTRTYSVPAGWLTVRIPGLCIVPTPNTGTTVVHVDPQHCTVA